MKEEEQLRYEYFIETGIVWIDTNDNIEMDYLKWVENRALANKQELHKFLQYLSDEDEVVGNRTHQQIIDGFKKYLRITGNV